MTTVGSVSTVSVIHPVTVDTSLPLSPYRLIVGWGADGWVEGVAAIIERLRAVTNGVATRTAVQTVAVPVVEKLGTLNLVKIPPERGKLRG